MKNKMTRSKLGQQLKAVRESKGIIKQRLVDQGITNQEITAIESGSTNYTVDKLLKYCNLIELELINFDRT